MNQPNHPNQTPHPNPQQPLYADNGQEIEKQQWFLPQPEKIPERTYWPAILALGITFLFWGLISSAIVSVMGLVLLASSLAGWIGELRHEG